MRQCGIVFLSYSHEDWEPWLRVVTVGDGGDVADFRVRNIGAQAV